MTKYLKEHEAMMQRILDGDIDGGTDWVQLGAYNKAHIGFIQHERLIHLLVTLAFALFFLLSVFFAVVGNRLEVFGLSLLFLVLLIPYIVHYYHLENGVQRLYKLDDEISERIMPNKRR